MEPGERRRDLRHIRLIAVYLGVGLALIGLGVLAGHLGAEWWDHEFTRDSLGLPVWLVGAGVISCALGAYELTYRLVHGPQPRGRHQRE